MEQKTKVNAEDGKLDLMITREFDLPVELLFKAHAEPEIVEQWMSSEYTITKLVKFDGKKHGSYQIQTSDPQGNVVFGASGVFHEFETNKKIIRTFEMHDTPYGVQLEVTVFHKVSDDKSKITIHVIYESVTQRDDVIKLGFAWGINMAHDKIQEIAATLK